jgi:hypothetical protein
MWEPTLSCARKWLHHGEKRCKGQRVLGLLQASRLLPLVATYNRVHLVPMTAKSHQLASGYVHRERGENSFSDASI